MPKGARKGKSKQLVTADIGTADFYKYYKENNFKNKDSKYYIDRTTYVKFMKLFFDGIIEKMIYENFEFKTPCKLGRFRIHKYKVKYKFNEEGKQIANIPVDWNKTLELWKNKPEAKEKNVLIRHLNKHSNGYVYKYYYMKNTSTVTNRYMWWFKPTRTNKIKLKEAINKGTINFFEL
jgi:hypothetical protein